MITNYTGTNILVELINKIYDSHHLSKEAKQKIVNKECLLISIIFTRLSLLYT